MHDTVPEHQFLPVLAECASNVHSLLLRDVDVMQSSQYHKPGGEELRTSNGALQFYSGIPLTVALRNRHLCVTPPTIPRHPPPHA